MLIDWKSSNLRHSETLFERGWEHSPGEHAGAQEHGLHLGPTVYVNQQPLTQTVLREAESSETRCGALPGLTFLCPQRLLPGKAGGSLATQRVAAIEGMPPTGGLD